MEQKYIVGDVVMYHNKIMVVKEPRDGNHFDLSCPKEGLVYCFVGVEDIKPVVLTPEILEKNGWKKSKINDCAYFYYKDGLFLTYTSKDGKFWFDDFDYSSSICVDLPYVHSLQHLLFGLGINSEMGGVGMGNKDDMMLGLILGVLIFLTIVVSAIAIKIGV